ncbi:pentatricopeptide repeat-containing protein [Crepidotus variabilis]|uniref:Pentatricopeptide repeat-containing protein n=1 Tax=Crepidotus variabilis TaxID=179855 RepID=A0A9P6JUI8_9AGAR|nr:pentatricopeptide repeat-containing protein [Crepidotus variabilis]
MLRTTTTGTISGVLCSRRQGIQTLSSWLEASHLLVTPTFSSSQRFASTTRRSVPLPLEREFPSLPRYLKRQITKDNSAKPGQSQPPRYRSTTPVRSTTPASSGSKTLPVFRSKHYDPLKETTPKAELKLLEPHVLSERLKKLSSEGKIDEAVFMLKNAPLDAQNTPVWNTMIWEAMKAHRYSLAYQLYIDLKRRGFSPTTRTYQTMFNGLSKIEDWTTHTKQLQNASSLYEGYQKHVASVKRHNPDDPNLTSDALAAYIRILGNAGKYQAAFDVYYAMDKDGPLAPNRFVYTAMFKATQSALGDTTEGRVKVAQDARLLWSQMMRAAKRNPELAPDSHVVVSAITALSGGNEMDHQLAFKIVEEYYGLVLDQQVSRPGHFPLAGESLIVILRLCNASKNYLTVPQFYQQIRRRAEANGGVSILDRGHMEEILRADLALGEPGMGYHALQTLEWMIRQEIAGPNGPKIRPSLSTYSLVAQACWQSADSNSIKRAFELMTGYHTHDFMDGSVADEPRKDKRQIGRSFPPNAEFISYMLRTAVASRNRADVRQALRIVSHIGYANILSARGDIQHETKKFVKRRGFIHQKFSESVVEAVTLLIQDKSKHIRPEELQTFIDLSKTARGESSSSNSKGEHRERRPRTATPPRSA